MDSKLGTELESRVVLGTISFVESDQILYPASPVIVPETPSPEIGKQRNCRRSKRKSSAASSTRVKQDATECSFTRKSKRQRLVGAETSIAPPSSLRVLTTNPGQEAASSSSVSSSAPPSMPDVTTAFASPRPSSSCNTLFLTEAEKRWLNGDNDPEFDEIIISDDEEEGTVEFQQLEEDEALARSLQDMYNQQVGETRQTNNDHHYYNPSGNRRYHTHAEPSWMYQMLNAVSPTVNYNDDGTGQRRQQARIIGRRADVRPFLSHDFLENDYETLLNFEEFQGAVVTKRLSRREIEMFPTSKFKSAINTKSTECRICCSDYVDGEDLRVLPCFHDFHVYCIDRWLKEKATCPLCRANLAEAQNLAPPTV